MVSRDEMKGLAGKISAVKREIGELKTAGQGFNCIERNVEKMLACVHVLELEISDAVEHIKKP
ncbi:MAG: hypothetical protein HY742_02770 [Deltaproteobacteria bacterium]|nr:hypothetical protein [Deltaproteobacteria bacterium]